MAYNLNDTPKHPYSMQEYQLFNLLAEHGEKATSYDLAEARKRLGKWKVKHPLATVTTTMQRLIDKVARNREPIAVCKDDKRPGHTVVEYYIKKRR
jgi:hypothetical protein